MHPGSRGHASAGPPQPGDSSSPLKLHAYSGPRAGLCGMPRKGGISIGAASSGRLTWMHGSGAQWPGLPLRQTYPGRLAASMLVVLERARGRTLGHLLPPHLPLPGLPLPRTTACKRARGAGARWGRTLGQQLPHGDHAVERRADLVAHARQELRLGLRRGRRLPTPRATLSDHY